MPSVQLWFFSLFLKSLHSLNTKKYSALKKINNKKWQRTGLGKRLYSREGRFERWLLFLVVIVDCFEWLFCYNHLPVPLFPIFLFLFFLLPHDSLLLPSLPHPLALSLSGLVRTQENDDAIFNQQQSIHSCVLCWRSAPSLARGIRLLRSLLFFFFFLCYGN